MEVGIRELKAHLSEYIEKALNGEPVVITDHGKAVVRLQPLKYDPDRLPPGLRRMVLEGRVHDPGPLRGKLPRRIPIELPAGETSTDWIKWARGCDHD